MVLVQDEPHLYILLICLHDGGFLRLNGGSNFDQQLLPSLQQDSGTIQLACSQQSRRQLGQVLPRLHLLEGDAESGARPPGTTDSVPAVTDCVLQGAVCAQAGLPKLSPRDRQRQETDHTRHSWAGRGTI